MRGDSNIIRYGYPARLRAHDPFLSTKRVTAFQAGSPLAVSTRAALLFHLDNPYPLTPNAWNGKTPHDISAPFLTASELFSQAPHTLGSCSRPPASRLHSTHERPQGLGCTSEVANVTEISRERRRRDGQGRLAEHLRTRFSGLGLSLVCRRRAPRIRRGIRESGPAPSRESEGTVAGAAQQPGVAPRDPLTFSAALA